MKNKKVLFGVILVVAFALGWLGYNGMTKKSNKNAEPEIWQTEQGPGHGFSRMATYLELDSGQWEQFRAQEQEYRNSFAEWLSKNNDTETLILIELSKEQPDTALLNHYAEQSGILKANARKLTINHFLKLKAICTPGQAEKFNTLFNEMERGQGFRWGRQVNGQRRGHGQGQGMQKNKRQDKTE